MSNREHCRIRLSMDPKERFPEKLYDVANDGYLVSWNGCGDGVIVNEEEFENKVMKCYPGFVQISSFANFRRLFREYGFDWEIIDRSEKHSHTFEFSHPSFKHGKGDLLCNIQTRRKSFTKPVHAVSNFNKEVAEISALSGKESEGRLTRTRVGRVKRVNYADLEKTKRRLSSSPEENFSTPSKMAIETSFRTDSTDRADIDDVLLTHIQEQQRKFEFDLRAKDFMKTFIKNEFTFDEFCVWADRNQQVFFDPALDSNKNCAVTAYDNTNIRQSAVSTPCGRCPCCNLLGFHFE